MTRDELQLVLARIERLARSGSRAAEALDEIARAASAALDEAHENAVARLERRQAVLDVRGARLWRMWDAAGSSARREAIESAQAILVDVSLLPADAGPPPPERLERARASMARFMAEGATAAGPEPSPLLARARGVPIKRDTGPRS